MASFKIIIGNKNYSTWSLRPWLALKHVGVPFEEITIPLYEAGTQARIREVSPSGKIPALIHDGVTVWESLAICEYLAELFPEARLWPEDRPLRAHARSLSAEMHSGFQVLREHLGMSIRASRPRDWFPPDVRREIARIIAMWQEARTRYGAGGPFLFGHFTIADAMLAPVAFRFRTYGVKPEGEARAYLETMLALPAMRQWEEAARSEPHAIPKFD
jgi:glutathione S-transferase